MGFLIREGKMGFGAEPCIWAGQLINRNAVASLYGEPLMCDISNSSYDTDADEGGIFGNGKTPVGDATATQDALISPWGAVQQAGVAVGSRVDVVFFGRAMVRCNSVAAVTKRGFFNQPSLTNTYVSLGTGSLNNLRNLGWNWGTHGGTGTETIMCLWDGLSTRP